jgi:hypothetical protein
MFLPGGSPGSEVLTVPKLRIYLSRWGFSIDPRPESPYLGLTSGSA